MNKLKTKEKWRKLSLLTLILLLSLCFNLHAQQITVTGNVTSADDSLPIPGAAVLVKGTNTGAATDFDGNYSIQASIGDLIEISYLGMETTIVKVSQAQMNVKMNSDLDNLDEVIVVGYGTQKKKEITGAVAQVKAEDIEQFITADVSSTLQGQIAGVNVTAGSGEPGESSNIQIRGVTSLSGSNTPLFVVNGVPQVGDPRLASNEIETIDVLKDAASTAVYGARGAAGVILITTKQGKEGQLNVDFNYTYGIQSLGEGTPLMNTADNLTYETNRNKYSSVTFDPQIEKFPSWINNDNKFDDYVLNNYAEVKTYNLGISGGAKNFSYSIVGGLFDQDGALVNSNFKRYNGRATTSYDTDNWKIQGSIGYTIENRKRASNGLIVQASRYKPYFPAIDPNEDVSAIGDSGGIRTPSVALNQALRQEDLSTRDVINANLLLQRRLSSDFTLNTRVGTSINNDKRHIFRPAFGLYNIETDEIEIDDTRNGVRDIASRTTKFSWDVSLLFNKSFGDHNVSASGTFTLEEDSFSSFDASIQGIANNNIHVLDGGTVNEAVNSGFNQDFPAGTQDNYNKKTVGTLARVQYNYKEKYLLSALVRYDGSSRFGRNYRWGTFPSISAGWNISSEPFWSPIKPVVNNFKLRLSHGTVGNDSFNDYEYSSTIAPFGDYVFDVNDNGEEFGTSIRSYANADVRWETSVSNNIGIDVSFLKNKFTLVADYYLTKKNDMLFPVTLPGSAGAYYDPILTLNIGDMENKGFELAANYLGKIGKSRLRVGGTFTKNENVITKMQPGVTVIPNRGVTLVNGDPDITVIAEGYEAGAFWLYTTNGVVQNDQQLADYQALENRENARMGDLIYVDLNNDGKIDNNDRSYKGSGLPDFEYGLNLSWNYAGFDFSMNWYGSVGAEVLNGNKALVYNFERHQDLVNMWTPNNPTSQTPLYRGAGNDHFNYSGSTDLWVESGDYLRLRQATIGYTLPKDVTGNIGLNTARLFFSAQNAITITDYEGYDPEVGGNNVARRGIDNSRYPLAAIYSLGLKFDF
ncbi:TonB-dependent receptor [Tamlana sp. 2_MG-2023]|uniref:SusC/RagA family TonB-linked outer membrane protein n=1 Tax=unclassified Tamlana TaxID=2614803 RepID=UPI0026E3D172|nr:MULTISPECIES: TonB-dependent receptor [unclassified Tamlana]MDO6760981.1 TonB-dependent receptor [Tamlana sp. 2_MG-2023]MDO6791237.1 TonB-dependent receptor [Tamlana sp. 1_MG-2023]